MQNKHHLSFSQTIRGFARYIIYIRFGEGKIIDFSTINLQLYHIILYLVFVVSAFWFEGVGAADHEEVLLRLGYHADVVLALRLKQLVGQMQ